MGLCERVTEGTIPESDLVGDPLDRAARTPESAAGLRSVGG